MLRSLTDEERAYIVRRAKTYDASLPDDFDVLMALPLTAVPRGLFNELLDSDLIEPGQDVKMTDRYHGKKKK